MIGPAFFAQGQSPPALSDLENIGTRDINRGQVNFTSIEKEIAMGRQLSVEIERQQSLPPREAHTVTTEEFEAIKKRVGYTGKRPF